MQYKDWQGPFCQSCGMPIIKPDDFGTGRDGSRVNDFCLFCFKDGAFTEPGITLPSMIDKCVAIVTEQKIMSEFQARTVMAEMIPKLKRWRK